MTPEQILMSQAVFHPPTPPKPKASKTGKVILVAMVTFGLSLAAALMADSAVAFLPAWIVLFVLGYGMFAEGK